MIGTHIFVFKLSCQRLDLQPLSLIVIERIVWVVGWSHTWRFPLFLREVF